MDYICRDDPWPRVPNATYEAQCIGYDRKFVLGKSRKLFLNFVIIEPSEHNGKVLFQAFNIPYDMKIRPGSKYYKTWSFVNGWKKPTRNDRMSPQIFKNKIFKVKTRTVKPSFEGKEMPEDFWYSCVDKLVEVVAG
jgi:hypothetical protein